MDTNQPLVVQANGIGAPAITFAEPPTLARDMAELIEHAKDSIRYAFGDLRMGARLGKTDSVDRLFYSDEEIAQRDADMRVALVRGYSIASIGRDEFDEMAVRERMLRASDALRRSREQVFVLACSMIEDLPVPECPPDPKPTKPNGASLGYLRHDPTKSTRRRRR